MSQQAFEQFQKIMSYLNVFVLGILFGQILSSYLLYRARKKRSETPPIPMPPPEMLSRIVNALKERGIPVTEIRPDAQPTPGCNCPICTALREKNQNEGGDHVLH